MRLRNKIRWILLCMGTLYIIFIPLAAEAKSIAVTVPDFQVKINGQTMENKYNQYPLLVYKNITYFPMAYDYARFLGVKANWYENKRVLFVGVSENPSNHLLTWSANTANKKTYTVTIPDYGIAVNTTNSHNFLDNQKEEYPILTFRNITYFPLTWRFAVDEFGWEYSWDSINGLRIDSSEPFRPVIDDSVIGTTMPIATGTDYFYGENYYVGYPINTFENNYTFISRKRGEPEKTFSLKDQLSGGDYYFNSRTDAYGLPADPTSDIPPAISGKIFSIVCRKGEINVLLKIDLDAGRIISEEVIAPKQVK